MSNLTLAGDVAATSRDEILAAPFTTNVEIEFTNLCNAECTACPRSAMPVSGFMTTATLAGILDLYDAVAASGQRRPRITVAGGGEPLLNKDAIALLGAMVARGYETHLITNATAITPAKAAQLAELGLRSVCVSFWGARKDEYEAAMQLPYESTLTKVELLRDALKSSPTELLVIWVRTDDIKSSDAEVKAHWDSRSIAVDLEDTGAWNRGGLLPPGGGVRSDGHLPDAGRRVWCADLFFSDSFNWRGEMLLCCCNYFTNRQIRIAASVADGRAKMLAQKQHILDHRPLPNMCRSCSLPRAKRARFLLREHLDRLSPEARSELTVFDHGASAAESDPRG